MLKPPETPPQWYCNFTINETLQVFQPLVYLVGLEPTVTPTHRLFWESLNLRAGAKDFQPHYATVGMDHKFRDKKAKADFHESSSSSPMAPVPPRGLIKSNWLKKHCEEIPSAIIVFFDMNWNDPQALWQERKLELAKQIKHLKASVNPHGTQILVMLLKSGDAGSGTMGHSQSQGLEDTFTTERASALCAAAEIPPKYLFVLPHPNSERITACIQRLEMGIRELSKAYYMNRIKRIKSWRDRITQTQLLVRYNFKIGFFQEVRKDLVAALNHYQTAYDALFNIKATDPTVQEIKVVASILNYRICRIHLSKPEGKDVKAQFDKHIKSFLRVEGNPQLLFEHYAWLAQEYYQFGELLQQFNRTGIPDPVTYFITAGKYIDKRRNDFYDRVKSKKPQLHWPPEMNPYILGEAKLVCYGQRPWWSNPFSHDYLHAAEDPNSILALQYFESLVKHSELIISRWGIGSEYCRTKQRLRCRCQLMSMMGAEFLKSKEFSKCTMLMTHVLREFGQENWTWILNDVANIGLKGACSNGDVSAYCNFLVVLLKLDLTSPSLMSEERQSELWAKLLDVINGKIPVAEPGCVVDTKAWEANIKTPWISYVEIHCNPILDVAAYFPTESAQVSKEPVVKFKIVNPSKFTIPIQKIGAKFNHPNYNLESANGQIIILPGQSTTMELVIKLNTRDLTKVLQLQVVYVDIGNQTNSVLLHYTVQRKLASYIWSNDPIPSLHEGDQSSKEINSPYLRIDPSKPLLSISTETLKNLVIVNDFTPITIRLKNEDTVDYTRIGFSSQVSSASGTGTKGLFLTPTISDKEINEQTFSHTYNTEIEKICAGEEYSLKMWMKIGHSLIPASLVSELKLVIKGKYHDSLHQPMTIEKTETFHIIEPFQIETLFTDLQNNIQDGFGSNQEFIAQITIQNKSMTKVKLENIELIPNIPQFTQTHQVEDFSFPKELNENESICSSFFMIPNESSLGSLSPGNFKISWRNLSYTQSSTIISNMTLLPIAPIEILSNSNSLYLSANYANNGHGKLKEPMCLDYTLVNHSRTVFDLHVSMEASEAYMNAGPKRVSLKLYGKEKYTFSYIIFPLMTGIVDAPKLSFSTQPNGTTILDPVPLTVYQNAPKTIYITS